MYVTEEEIYSHYFVLYFIAINDQSRGKSLYRFT